MLKSRKAGLSAGHTSTGSAASVASGSSRQSNKRYLILTYTVEYDRVHYPLPLAFEEVPSASSLKRVIRRLRSELREERRRNELLNQNLAAADSSTAAADTIRKIQEEVNGLRQRLKKEAHTRASVETVLDKLRSVSKSELARLRRENARLQEQLNERDEEGAGRDEASAEIASLKETVQNLRTKCRELTRELALSKRGAKSTLAQPSRRGLTQSTAASRAKSGNAGRTTSGASRPWGGARRRTPSPMQSRTGSRTRPRSRSGAGEPRPGGHSPVPSRRTGAGVGTSRRRASGVRTSGGSQRSRGSAGSRPRRVSRSRASSLASGSDSDRSVSHPRRVFDPTAYEKQRQKKLRERRRSREQEREALLSGSLSDASEPRATSRGRPRRRSQSPLVHGSGGSRSRLARKPATARQARSRSASRERSNSPSNRSASQASFDDGARPTHHNGSAAGGGGGGRGGAGTASSARGSKGMGMSGMGVGEPRNPSGDSGSNVSVRPPPAVRRQRWEVGGTSSDDDGPVIAPPPRAGAPSSSTGASIGTSAGARRRTKPPGLPAARKTGSKSHMSDVADFDELGGAIPGPGAFQSSTAHVPSRSAAAPPTAASSGSGTRGHSSVYVASPPRASEADSSRGGSGSGSGSGAGSGAGRESGRESSRGAGARYRSAVEDIDHAGPGAPGFQNASAEILEIDARVQALQHFLDAARSGTLPADARTAGEVSPSR